MKDIIIGENNLSSDDYISNPLNYRFWLKKDEVKKIKGVKYLGLHFNVLPHPFFGNIDTPKILFIGKNPSYADYYEDEVDTYLYLKNHNSDLSSYIDNLKNANFFKEWNDGENISFISSWKWWNNKIIRGAKFKDENLLNEIGFINLCGYQSKSFDAKYFELFRSVSEEDFTKAVNSAKVIIVVWGKALELGNIKAIIGDKPCLALNKNKTGANVNSLYKIVKEDCPEYNSKEEIEAIEILRYYFK